MVYIDDKLKGINFNTIINKYNGLFPDKKIMSVKTFRYGKSMEREIFNYNGCAR